MAREYMSDLPLVLLTHHPRGLTGPFTPSPWPSTHPAPAGQPCGQPREAGSVLWRGVLCSDVAFSQDLRRGAFYTPAMATTDLKHLGFVKTYGTAGVEAVANSKTCVCPAHTTPLRRETPRLTHPYLPCSHLQLRQGGAAVRRRQGERGAEEQPGGAGGSRQDVRPAAGQQGCRRGAPRPGCG